jgi:hypothetical protein
VIQFLGRGLDYDAQLMPKGICDTNLTLVFSWVKKKIQFFKNQIHLAFKTPNLGFHPFS